MVTMFHIFFIVGGSVEERRYRDHKDMDIQGKMHKASRRMYGEGERPRHRSKHSKRQAASGGDGTLVTAKQSRRDKIAINIICYQLKI